MPEISAPLTPAPAGGVTLETVDVWSQVQGLGGGITWGQWTCDPQVQGQGGGVTLETMDMLSQVQV